MPKTNKNAPEKWGVNTTLKLIRVADVKYNVESLFREDISMSKFTEILNEKANESLNELASNKPILGNKEKKIAFLSFYAKNKGNINMKAYAESIGVDRTTLYNWIKGK